MFTVIMSKLLYLNLAVIAVCIAIYWKPIFDLLLGPLGKITIVNPLEDYANGTGLNNEKCFVNYEMNACEDIKIHFDSGIAFAACGDPIQRSFFYPPSCARNAKKRTDFQEHFFAYNIDTNKTTRLEVIGYDGDIINHGIDIYTLDDSNVGVKEKVQKISVG